MSDCKAASAAGYAGRGSGESETCTTATARNPRLRVDTVSHGSKEPAVDYPSMDFALTAGAWNAVAAANQRVAFRLLPNNAPRR